MRKLLKPLIPIFLLLVLSSSQSEYEDYAPILMLRSDLELSVKSVSSRPMQKPGKIYFKDSTIFIVEQYLGVHVIDNRNPSSPSNVGYIVLPGCVDIAIKGSTLYADNATDLVSIDIVSFPTISVLNRTVKVFPELRPPDGREIPSQYRIEKRPSNTVIVGWETINNNTYEKE